LALMQLDQKLKPIQAIWSSFQIPKLGWIRAIRDALGMSGRQLAERLAVKPPRISILEKAELEGKVTLKTMKRTSEALGCHFVYAIIPGGSLEQIVLKQVVEVLQDRMARTSHSMALEDQKLAESEEKQTFQDLIDETIRKIPRSLWDKR